ncbi:hypothetical protein DWF00_04670 [Bosea caraganae]|uniref:Nucleotidyltransferase-like domain-containing protein n=1 Tax=Bosea caraganae TaxID=2763117 RepID=A0A370L0S5_9HYPH|nr:nucleotidyltransferase domain-containing protein [Bosea caraganae]RDJ20462.1 hypothetical protein DWE98_24380 [Bosea caraganae]RDJ29977.1 hypothetical protein DWF00_04670 [Bosea caraganae]
MQPLNNDQRRETVNTRQRYEAFRAAKARIDGYRGSMVWSPTKGTDYLLRSAYDEPGRRRQKSLGPRSAETERVKQEFDIGREEAKQRFEAAKAVLERQGAVNRALGLGRVPLTGARIIRQLDDVGLLGKGLRVVGTHAIYAYEAVAGLFADPEVTTTEDIDLLYDARRELGFIAQGEIAEAGLIGLLKRVDRSFERTRQDFRAVNQDGYLVDLIRPDAKPPWKEVRESLADAPGDLAAVAIEGLEWLENAASFEAVAIDERGMPLRLIAVDPRVFAAHKLWVAQQPSRDPVKRARDRAQAQAVARLVSTELPHLRFDGPELRMLPKAVFEAARPLFEAALRPG